jgi:predicted O-methyltransferase YrrM
VAEPSFLSEEKVCFGDLEIFLLHGNSTEELSGRDDLYYMVKTHQYVQSYERIKCELNEFRTSKTKNNVIEIGIFRGGSTPFLYKFFDANHLVCFDRIKDCVPSIERFKSTVPYGNVRAHYGIDQADREAVMRIVTTDFDDPIDLVVDDASHMYEKSKATFEAVFPYMRPGGIYVIEDWTWAHGKDAQEPGHYWANELALTNLVLRLVIASASPSGLLAGIGFATGMMWVRKGWKNLPKGDFYLDDYAPMRGRSLSLI